MTGNLFGGFYSYVGIPEESRGRINRFDTPNQFSVMSILSYQQDNGMTAGTATAGIFNFMDWSIFFIHFAG